MHRLLTQASRRASSRLLDRCNGPACLIPSQLLSDPSVGSRQQSTTAAAAAPSPPPNSIEVFVDGAAVHVQKGSSVLQVHSVAEFLSLAVRMENRAVLKSNSLIVVMSVARFAAPQPFRFV